MNNDIYSDAMIKSVLVDQTNVTVRAEATVQ